MTKYEKPDFIPSEITQKAYTRWLHYRAAAHRKRDRKRGNDRCTIELYKSAIHVAVTVSGGLDAYTGEMLDWHLISQYNNDQSKLGRRKYKKVFAMLPTVDHVGDGTGDAEFLICAWKTNDAKNDLSYSEFVDLCRKVVAHADRLAASAATVGY